MRQPETFGSLRAASGTKVTGWFDVAERPGGPIRCPVGLVNGAEDGPRLSITAGVHGTEYVAQEAAVALSRCTLKRVRVPSSSSIPHRQRAATCSRRPGHHVLLSLRNRPLASMVSRCWLVAAITRKSERTTRVPPTRSNSLSSMARSSLACISTRQVPDFIEKHGAVVRQFELAGLAIGLGAREGALFVTEQFGFEQIARDGGTVDGHEGVQAARPLAWWMAWANSSLPVPLSPVMSTGKLLPAALRASLFTERWSR